MELTCSSCKSRISPDYFFCAHCGKKLRQSPISLSFGKQIGVYALSVFCPPFGLFPAFRYLQQPTMKATVIGCIAMVLTSLSLIISTYFALSALAMFLPFLTSSSVFMQ